MDDEVRRRQASMGEHKDALSALKASSSLGSKQKTPSEAGKVRKKIATKINFTRNRVGDEVRAKKMK